MTVAHYSQGALLLADTISEGNSRVLLVGRDLTIPPVGTSTGSGPGLREFVCEISPPTAGNDNNNNVQGQTNSSRQVSRCA